MSSNNFVLSYRVFMSDFAGLCYTVFKTCRLNVILLLVHFNSYPTSTVVPMSTTDDQVRALSHCHQNGRYPVVVWVHPSNTSMLLRASAMRSRTIGMLFKHGPTRCKLFLRRRALTPAPSIPINYAKSEMR